MINISILDKFKKTTEKRKKRRYRELRYVCNKCGAFNHRYQGICGMCMSSHLRRATSKEKEDSISIIESLIENNI